MKASDLPPGAQFTLEGSDVLYTVTHQVPGRLSYSHLTYVCYFDPLDEAVRTAAWAGHTEVIHCPPTQADGTAQEP